MSSGVKIGREIELSSTGLVRELTELMLEKVPTHPDWCESLACAIIGMMAGRERYIANDFGTLNANIFVIYIGASGLSFKTVPLKKVVRPLLKMLTAAVNEEICQRFGTSLNEMNKKYRELNQASSRTKGTAEWKMKKFQLDRIKEGLVDFMTLQKFTSEKLTSWLNQFPQGMIAGDEYTKMFKGAKKKDYLTDNMEDLSRLYDCDVEKVGTQVRGVEYPEEAYVSFCSATTYYLLTLMGDDFFVQGTGNRILWILDDVMQKVDVQKEALSGEFFWAPEKKKEFDEKLATMVQMLMNIQELPEDLVEMDLDASILLDKYRLDKYNDAVDLFLADLLDKDANLMARLAQNAMKLALIHCVGRYALDERGSTYESMMIMPEDATWAIEKMERHYLYYKKLREVAARIRETTTRSYKTDQERILYLIDRLELRAEKLTANRLRQQTGWLKEDCQKVLDTMVANKEIRVVQELKLGKRHLYYARI